MKFARQTLKELFFIALCVMVWYMVSRLLIGCSNDDWKVETYTQYKAIGHDFAIEVISQDETTIEVKMIWNKISPDDVTCKTFLLDRRVLEQYEICKGCPNNCDD